MNKLINSLKQFPLFYASVLAAVVEIFEVINKSCGIWQQEFSLLFILGILGLIKTKNKLFALIATAVLIGFYVYEFYEQFFEMEVCGTGADQLNLLLGATIIAAIGIYYNTLERNNIEK
mgnify:CR=1 FL=1